MLQQCLPFTVLKPNGTFDVEVKDKLQQCLPFTVLKPSISCKISCFSITCCCNSTYRLRYVPQGAGQQRSKAMMRAAHRKYLSEVKVKRR